MPIQENRLDQDYVDRQLALIVPTKMSTNGINYQGTEDATNEDTGFDGPILALEYSPIENKQFEFPDPSQMSTQINETSNVENLKEVAGEIDKEAATKEMNIQLTYDQRHEKLLKMRPSLLENPQQLLHHNHLLASNPFAIQEGMKNLKTFSKDPEAKSESVEIDMGTKMKNALVKMRSTAKLSESTINSNISGEQEWSDNDVFDVENQNKVVSDNDNEATTEASENESSSSGLDDWKSESPPMSSSSEDDPNFY